MKNLIAALCLLCPLFPLTAKEVEISEGKIIKLTEFPATLQVRTPLVFKAEKEYSSIKPIAHDLGMAGVPVLDQGAYGTCVTFASSAALDAIIGQGDFVSPACSLALDLALGSNFWDGAYFPSQIIDPLKKYGVVAQSVCPRRYGDVSFRLPPSEYARYVDAGASAVVKGVSLQYYPNAELVYVKKAIDAGHRIMVGFLIKNAQRAVRGFDVVYQGKRYSGGLWACKQGFSSNYCVSSNAGHEVVIVGYDDSQELLKIRNSWGSGVGQEGEYFMTYKFFESMANDVTEIW